MDLRRRGRRAGARSRRQELIVPPSPALAGFTVIDVYDPAEMDEQSRVSRRLPGGHDVHTYTLRDRTLGRSGAGRLLARNAGRFAGDLFLAHVAERLGRKIGITEPGLPAFCLTHLRSGGIALSTPDAEETTEPGAGQGLIQGGRPGTRLLTGDGTIRTNFMIATARFESALEACLGERLRAPLVFAPALDWTSGTGRAAPPRAALRRGTGAAR